MISEQCQITGIAVMRLRKSFYVYFLYINCELPNDRHTMAAQHAPKQIDPHDGIKTFYQVTVDLNSLNSTLSNREKTVRKRKNSLVD